MCKFRRPSMKARFPFSLHNMSIGWISMQLCVIALPHFGVESPHLGCLIPKQDQKNGGVTQTKKGAVV